MCTSSCVQWFLGELLSSCTDFHDRGTEEQRHPAVMLVSVRYTQRFLVVFTVKFVECNWKKGFLAPWLLVKAFFALKSQLSFLELQTAQFPSHVFVVKLTPAAS